MTIPSRSPHRNKPSYRFEDVKLLDPFAGFGSIPLEALRPGLSATAVELIPTAYVFLKAVLDYLPQYVERAEIKVVDLNRPLGDKSITEAKVVDRDKKEVE